MLHLYACEPKNYLLNRETKLDASTAIGFGDLILPSITSQGSS
jgi:hypothetical protein